jgi:AAA domain/TOTE conflict system, Archaeo-Eukaryotic Primase domain
VPTTANSNLISRRTAEAFRAVWRGHSDRSRYHCPTEGNPTSHNGSATAKDFDAHLAGKFCLSLVPVNEAGQCRWAAIDVDLDTIDHGVLAKEVERRRMPLIVCRSKSGGAHLFVFFKALQSARSIQNRLKKFAKALGHPDAEIFPKQNRLGPTDKGNGIRLPYRAGNRSTEYAYASDGQALLVDGFIKRVELVRVTDLSQLEDIDLTPAPSTEKEELQSGLSGRVESGTKKIREGSRVNSLVSRVGRLSKIHILPEGIQADVTRYNEIFCDPPLTQRELEQQVFPAIHRFTRPPEVREVIPLRVSTSAELLDRKEIDDTVWDVKGLNPRASHEITIGRPKSGKSLKGQQKCFEASAGLPVYGGFKVPEPLRVLYVDFAQSAAETRRRHLQMVKGYPKIVLPAENLFFMTKDDLRYAKALASEIADIGNPRSLEFTELLVEKRIQFLTIAEIRSLVRLGGNLKDQDVAELINSWIEWLQLKTGITTETIHHSRKGDAQTGEAESFGSTMLTAAPDAIISLKRLPSGLRRVHVEARFDAPADFLLELQNAGAGGKLLRVVEDPEEALNRKIMELHQQGLSIRGIAREVHLPHATVGRRLQAIRVREDGKGEGQPELFEEKQEVEL